MARKFRTAVLVVHGMGSQRPLETVRGIVDAVWLCPATATAPRNYWTHPELSGVDIDLEVMTTNQSDVGRVTDFHELYWAHLMSETRAVAVLLWLFELCRKGPLLRSGMNMLWWGVATFLALLILSVVLVALKAVTLFAQLELKPAALLVAPTTMILIAVLAIVGFSCLKGAFRFAEFLLDALRTYWIAALIVVLVLAGLIANPDWIRPLANTLPTYLFAFAIAIVVMGKPGVLAFGVAVLLSVVFFGIFLISVALGLDQDAPTVGIAIATSRLPWSLHSQASLIAAWSIIAVYVAINLGFLLPYLGDAARYFRNSPGNVAVRREIRGQAVDTLESLHTCGDYDRIVVVAHSLGTVVAYDMLRNYFGRIASRLPTDASVVDEDFDDVDYKDLAVTELRSKARNIVRKLFAAEANALKGKDRKVDKAGTFDTVPKAWLVTDFVTMGSPLAHAYYLMCLGKTEPALHADFNRRVSEREFPVCPPQRDDGKDGGRLTFKNGGKRQFHHGAMFGLTRWTNLFFPRVEILWGDAIGGECSGVFGPGVVDVPVYANLERENSFFAHVLYWNIKQPLGCNAPHIQALGDAINLKDA